LAADDGLQRRCKGDPHSSLRDLLTDMSTDLQRLGSQALTLAGLEISTAASKLAYRSTLRIVSGEAWLGDTPAA